MCGFSSHEYPSRKFSYVVWFVATRYAWKQDSTPTKQKPRKATKSTIIAAGASPIAFKFLDCVSAGSSSYLIFICSAHVAMTKTHRIAVPKTNPRKGR